MYVINRNRLTEQTSGYLWEREEGGGIRDGTMIENNHV